MRNVKFEYHLKVCHGCEKDMTVQEVSQVIVAALVEHVSEKYYAGSCFSCEIDFKVSHPLDRLLS